VSDIAIKVEGLGKQYRIGSGGGRSSYKSVRDVITQTALAPARRLKNIVRGDGSHHSGSERFWALKDVSFEVKHGEVLGVIGRNGAGKSTLLKVLTRITEPTEGEVRIRGRVGSLLEVGTGFHPELTGRENVYLNGAILGMHRREIASKFDEIVAFAEVEKFIDTPVKRYSSGMYLRLAFSVAAHLEPEILLVDEVLAVGDAAFQKKCLGKMGDVAQQGRTVLFVSHNMAAVDSLCRRGLVLNQGQTKFLGSQTDAIGEYLTAVGQDTRLALEERRDRKGSGEVRITNIELRDISGAPIDHVMSGQDVDIYMNFEKAAGYHSQNVTASLIVKTQFDVPVFLHHNRLTHDEFGALPEKGAFVLRIPRLPLPPATYRLGFSIQNQSDYLDNLSDAVDLTVISGNFYGSGEVPPISHGVSLVDGRWRAESI
jgi:lipopolysaccharide transport system ATP-binding protein